jgi:hypothetical protein
MRSLLNAGYLEVTILGFYLEEAKAFVAKFWRDEAVMF